MKNIATLATLLLVTLLVVPVAARAQERPGAVYLGAAVSAAWAQGVTENGFRIYVASPGGWSPGWSAGGGVFLLRRASVEFEVFRTGFMKSTQPSRYGMIFHEERRDTFFTAAVRLHLRPDGILDFEPVVGFDIVRGEAWHCTDHTNWATGEIIACGSERWHDAADAVAGFSAGADARIGGRRAALVVTFRTHRTFRGEQGSSWYPNGTAGWTLRTGAGVRVVFWN
ncbi:MAG: hypothetical protein ACE148_17510 [Vicinamibacterales bacterium]